MTKIISFSLWGDNPKYCIGAIKNAQLAQVIYPDWECWFYYPIDNPPSIIPTLEMMQNVKLKPVNQPGDWRGMFWRFEAAADPSCEAMISRDCDSRLSIREKMAVDEWLDSEKTWHIMRDHPWHGTPILGGMWGVKGCIDMSKWINSWIKEDRYQTDQDFLKFVVYPIARSNAMIHASFCAIEAYAIPFPGPREGLEFVGQVFDEKDTTIAEHQTMLARTLK